MYAVVANLAVLLLMSAVWFGAGVGVTFLLVSRRHRAEALLLAPTVGMCLVCLVGVFQISVVLIPFTPRLHLVLLILVSVLICLVGRKRFGFNGGLFCRRLLWLCAVPALYLVAFAGLFQKEGFHLLVGSSDQLQYCLNAEQILKELHTGSEADVPLARREYLVHDFVTRTQPYRKNWRRGAEVLLASTAALTGLTLEQAFPVVVGATVFSLGLALAYLARVCLRLRRPGGVALQLAVLASFCLTLLHVQGSLACLTSLPLRLVGVALLPPALRFPSWRRIVLAGIFVAGIFTVYPETALITIVAPGALLATWGLAAARGKRFQAGLGFAAVLGFALLCTPFGVYATVVSTFNNLGAGAGQFAAAKASSSAPGGSFLAWLTSMQWTNLGPVVGMDSYYDSTLWNVHVSQSMAERPWLVGLGFAGFSVLGVIGCAVSKTRAGRLFAVVLLAWVGCCFACGFSQDGLRFVRSGQYALFYAVVGLVLLVVSRRRSWPGRLVAWASAVPLVAFVLLNARTSYDTFNYLVGHNTVSDPIVLRFNSRDPAWRALNEELQPSRDVPVLISGFTDTVRPLLIVSGIPNRPHFLGDTMKFWPLIELTSNQDYQPMSSSTFNTRLSKEAFAAALQRREQWDVLIPRFLGQSVQAVVPVGHGFPAEWDSWKDVFPPRVVRFPNLCDVIYKKERALSLTEGMAGPLERDEYGLYRVLQAGGPVLPQAGSSDAYTLTLRYDGNLGEVKLHVGDAVYTASSAPGPQAEVAAPVTWSDLSRISLEVEGPVKLRSVAWEPSPAPAK